MVAKNNLKKKAQQDAKQVPHYGIRKLSIGVASVLLSTTLYFGMNVHADTVANSSTEAPTNAVTSTDSESDQSTQQVSTSLLTTGTENAANGQEDNTTSATNSGQPSSTTDTAAEQLETSLAKSPTSESTDCQVTFQLVDGENYNLPITDTTNTTVTVTGKVGDTVAVNLTIPDNYELKSGQTLPTSCTFTSDDVVSAGISKQIYLQHKIVKVDSTNYTDDQFKNSGLTASDFKKTLTRTIKVQKPGSTTAEDHSQEATVTRWGMYDLVTKKIHALRDCSHISSADLVNLSDQTYYYGPWSDYTFAEYDAPTVAGYTPNQATVAAASGSAADYSDSPITITYTANDQTTHIIYQDTEGNKIKTDTVTGKTDQTVNTNSTVPTGWVIASGTVPTTITFTGASTPDTYITIKHGTNTSTDTKIITRTINVTAPDGTKSQKVQTATLTRDKTTDQVTGDVTYGDWSTDSTSWSDFKPAEVPGYTASSTDVPAVTVSSDTEDSTIDITYTPNEQTTHIVYQDPAGTTVKTDTISGKTGQTVKTNSAIPTGWVMDGSGTVPTEITFAGASTPDTVIKIKHGTTLIQPTNPVADNAKTPTGQTINGAHNSDLNKTITRTINITNPDGTMTQKVQTVKLTRTATVDNVTGDVTYGDWSTGSFDEYTVPGVAGYTPTQATVPVATVTSNTTDSTVNISYAPNNQTTHIVYQDKDGNKIKTDTVTGQTDQTVDTNSNLPAGWVISTNSSVSSVPKTVTFKGASTPDTVITIEHGKTTIKHDNPAKDGDKIPSGQTIAGAHETDLNKTIVRTITVTNPDGTSHVTTQTAKIYRDATVDEVTGEVTYGDWSTDTTDWSEFDTPAIAGYTPTQAKVEAQTVTSDTADTPIDITYTANDQTTHIIYQDPDGNRVKTDTVNGKTDQTVPTNSTIPTGWVLDDDGAIPTEITFKGASTPDTVIKIKHGTTLIQPTNPVKDGEKTPTGQTISGAHQNDLNKTITRTINVTKPDGSSTQEVQTAKLTRTATVDNVTGDVTYGSWSTGSFDAYNVPDIAGYTPTQTVIAKEDVNSDTNDQVVAVSYVPNDQQGRMIYVDSAGHTVKTEQLTGKTGETITLHPVAPDGYVIDSSASVPSSVTASADGISTVVVHVLKTVPWSTIGAATVTNRVNYVDPTGRIIKTTTVTGHDGDAIAIAVPDGYRLTNSGLQLTINRQKPVQVVEVEKISNQSDSLANSAVPGKQTSAAAQVEAMSTGQILLGREEESQAQSNELPQTGSNQQQLAAGGLVSLALAGMLGMLGIKRKRNN